MVWKYDFITLFLVLVSGYFALRVKDTLASVILLGAYSFLMCLIWVEMGAIDVAFTEAAVGAGVTTVFFIAMILRTTRRTSD